MGNNEFLEFSGTVVHQTESAVLITVDEVEEDIWFPLSQLETDDLIDSGEYIEFTIPEWLAIDKDLV